MRLVQVVGDDTMMVPGYEHHTFECSTCGEVERRLVFRRSPTGRMVQIDYSIEEDMHIAKTPILVWWLCATKIANASGSSATGLDGGL
jgi:hypothetical protein